MNSNGVVIHSNRLVNNGVQSQNLQNGSSVLVRVASYKGNGVYEGFVAGVKVNITSQKQLQIGQSFPAKIFVKDGIIQLKSDILTKPFFTGAILLSLYCCHSNSNMLHLWLTVKTSCSSLLM